MKVNFVTCAAQFNHTNTPYNHPYENYTWNGTVRGIANFDPSSRTSIISLDGCRRLCGTGNQYYPWETSSSTISTWILPITGILLQAPFESNEISKTIYAIARWLGSPIASLSYILWNVKVTSKCALLVDMSTVFEEVPDNEDSQFAQIRDSLYILSVMNQYTIKPRMPTIEAEKLLRIALFSDTLQLEAVEYETRNLVQRRRQLARLIREERRKGAVPVFISLMWFLFSLAISLQAAFGQLGSNAGAHDLALGLLLAWVPVLILCSIVDRNPISSENIRIKLNHLLDAVGGALVNPDLRNTYIADTKASPENFTWTMYLNDEAYFQNDFFTRFAGQGRIRWHYGVAHPIIAGIEDSFVADYGRDWLRNAEQARTKLVKGPLRITGLNYFDLREFWQILSSIFIVCGSVSGAFIISFTTPTFGLGCRSGGYLIFCVIALGLFITEMLCWWLIPEAMAEDLFSKLFTKVAQEIPRMQSVKWTLSARNRVRRTLIGWSGLTTRGRAELLFLRPAELVNTTWLCYIILAQTFGWYRNCKCMSSVWGGSGGYIDFAVAFDYIAHDVVYYWASGVALSLSIMLISFGYIVAEWCTQSHLSTENYHEAAKGLMTTRWYKRYTLFVRRVPDVVIELAKHAYYRMANINVPAGSTNRRSLVWTARVKARHKASTAGIPDEPQPTPNSNSNSGGDDNYDEALLWGAEDRYDRGYPMTQLSPPIGIHSRSPRSSFGEHSSGLSVRPATNYEAV